MPASASCKATAPRVALCLRVALCPNDVGQADSLQLAGASFRLPLTSTLGEPKLQ